MNRAPPDHTDAKLRTWLPPMVALLLFCTSFWILHHEFRAIPYRDVREALIILPTSHILGSLLLTAASYLALTTYDQLAFLYIGKQIARWRIGLTAFISYAVSNNVGFALLSGAAVRHRFYSRWGVATADLSRIVALNSSTYWLGMLMLGGGCLAFYPYTYLSGGLVQSSTKWLSAIFMITATGYLIMSALRTAPMRVRGFEMKMPSLSLAIGQLLVSMTDLVLAAAVLYALLPDGGPSYRVLLGAFFAAQVFGIVSHVPGGLGVFESTMLLLLRPYLPADQSIAALLLFRLVYYIIPLTIALVVLLVDEAWNQRVRLLYYGKSLGGYSVQLAPKMLSLFTFMAGLLLLVSGATPAEHGRLQWLARLLPVGLFETSHFLGSLIGVALLVLAQAVSRRIQLSYYLVLVALLAGIVTCLLKAADWEEAIILGILLVVFVPSRSFFDRRAALFDTRFSPGWIIAIVAALGASVWLGIFAFRHVEYSHDLWWQVALHHDAPRFMRASLGAAVALLGFSLWHLLRPLPHIAAPPSSETLAEAARIINLQPETLPLLVYLRDKSLYFNTDRTAFVMYGVRGRTWVALGDPVGPASAAPSLIRRFIERADDYGGLPVFYQVKPSQLSFYADLGMSFAKLGEEARVPLENFSVEGSQYKKLRSVLNRLNREKVSFRLIEAAAVPAILPRLRTVSDDWLSSKSVSEKGFSLGFFDDSYLSRLPVALLEREGRILAFANLLCVPSGEEFSVDLMRFASSAPHNAMEGLFTHLFLWGKMRGYRWFNLGMAPLSGLYTSPISPLWARLATLIYRHGEALYNFEGLRAYKEKFKPIWEPRYLAYPGGAALFLVLADITALSAGGYIRVFR